MSEGGREGVSEFIAHVKQVLESTQLNADWIVIVKEIHCHFQSVQNLRERERERDATLFLSLGVELTLMYASTSPLGPF